MQKYNKYLFYKQDNVEIAEKNEPLDRSTSPHRKP